MTAVDKYWSNHVVGTKKHFGSKEESTKYAKWRLDHTPFHREFMGYDEPRSGEIILDYGCGPGNDIVNFISNTEARKIIGMDISQPALNFAKRQIALYNTPIEIELVKITDKQIQLPLQIESIDYVFCSGVLQHTSNPIAILKEFYRVLKKDSMARIMVYNRDSIWFHVYVADEKRFPKTTDGANCPISRAWKPEDFMKICDSVGFRTKFLGGYFASHNENIAMYSRRKPIVMADPRVSEEHKTFIRDVEIRDGHFWYKNKPCGIGGVYELYK